MGFLEEARKRAEAEFRAREEAQKKGKPSSEEQDRLIAEYDRKCEIDYNHSVTNMNLSPFPRITEEFRIVAPRLKKEISPRYTSSLDTSLFDRNHVSSPGGKLHRRHAVCLELKWDYSDSEGATKGTYKEIDITFYGDGKIIVKGNERGETIMVREEWYQKPENAETALEKAFRNPQMKIWDRSGHSENAGPGSL